MKAAVGVVALVFGLVQLFGLNDAQRDVVRSGEGPGLVHVAAGKAWRVGQNGQHAVAENAMRGGGEISRIDAAGVGHHDAAERAQAIFECVQFLRGLRGIERDVRCA